MLQVSGALLRSICLVWFVLLNVSACREEALQEEPDLSLVYDDQGKVEVVVPASFAGHATGNPATPSYEAAFTAEVEQSVLQAIELFPYFKPSIKTSNAANAISIQRIDLYKERSVNLVSGTASSAGFEVGTPMEVNIGGAKFSGSMLYDLTFSEWSAVVRGSVGGTQPFMISLGKPYLRRYDKVRFKYSGSVDADLLKFLPDAVGALITKAFGDIFTIRGGYVSDSQYQDFVALALMKNVDQPGEVSEFVYELTHKLAEKCKQWAKEIPEFNISSCDHDAIHVTSMDEAFSMKVKNLGKVAASSTMMQITQCRAIDPWTYLFYVPYFVTATQKEHYLYRLSKSETWQPIFGTLFDYPNIKVEFLATETSEACGYASGDCSVFKHVASYVSVDQVARDCATINICGIRTPQFAISGQLQETVIELGKQRSDCAVMTAGTGGYGSN